MKICFIPFYAQCPQHKYAASARIRAEWPAKYLCADVCSSKFSVKDLLKYEIIIFQKCYNFNFIEVANSLKRWNKKIILVLDLCDAEWITRESELRQMINIVDFLTVSTDSIRAWVNTEFPLKNCYVIPDGHDLDYYQPDKMPEIINEPLKYAWFGNIGTIKSLEAIMMYLEQLSGEFDSLTIISDELSRNKIKSEKLKIRFFLWRLETVNTIIRSCNLSLNPRLETDEYKVKSNNKTAMSYILGLPCIDRSVNDETGWRDDLINMRNYENRKKDIVEKREHFLQKYSMNEIALIWLKVLDTEYKKCYN